MKSVERIGLWLDHLAFDPMGSQLIPLSLSACLGYEGANKQSRFTITTIDHIRRIAKVLQHKDLTRKLIPVLFNTDEVGIWGLVHYGLC